MLKSYIAKETVSNRIALISLLIKLWFRNETFLKKIRSCIDSIPQRMQAVIEAKGGHTRY